MAALCAQRPGNYGEKNSCSSESNPKRPQKKHFVILLLCACVKDNHINIYSHLTAYITIIS